MLLPTGVDSAVRPDAGSHVTRAGGEVAASRARRNRDDRVLVALEHELRIPSSRVPELHAAVLGARHDP